MTRAAWGPTIVIAIGCGSADFQDVATTIGGPAGHIPPLDTRPAVLADVPPPPIMGGGLLVLSDDLRAVTSDPDRDRVHVVDLVHAVETHVIDLGAGDRPWRLVEDAAGRVHVVARGAGEIVSIDPDRGEIIGRHAVCRQPRGIDVLPDGETLVVACAEGSLVWISAHDGSVAQTIAHDADLRDVVVLGGEPWVGRFRDVSLSPADDPDERVGPFTTIHIDPARGQEEDLVPNTAWRTVAFDDNTWLTVHQAATTRVVALPGEADGSFDDGGSGGDASYGGGAHDPCTRLVHSIVTIGDRYGDVSTSGSIMGALLPVDVAVSGSREAIAIALAGNRGDTVMVLDAADRLRTPAPPCREPDRTFGFAGQIVAVAFDGQDRLLALSREPAVLHRLDLETGEGTHAPLTSTSALDTGHELFHMDAGGGIACASCHAEGGDDGHVWRFAGLGLRHTPALDVGLAGTEPFHWNGELPDIAALLDEVHGRRMGGARQTAERADAFARWMFALGRPAMRVPDDASARGRAVFDALACGTCHAGAALASTASVDLGFEEALQVPPLRGIATHPPYMHDGRAHDLRSAIEDMIARTRPSATVTEGDIDDLVAYLQTL